MTPSSSADRDHSRAVECASAGRHAEAARFFDSAAATDPTNCIRHFNRGRAWHQAGDFPKAVAAYRQAVALQPSFFDAWANLCAALKVLDRAEEAVAAGERAVQLKPASSAAWLNLGVALKAAGDWSRAEGAYRKATEADPASPWPKLNLANTLREAGRTSEAVPLLREIVRQHPNVAQAHRDLAFALLLTGKLREGWDENEWRWQTPEMRGKQRVWLHPDSRQPLPDLFARLAQTGGSAAEMVRGQTVLIHCEQGLGDAIQFVRYVPLLAAWSAKVVLECPAALEALFRSVDGVHQLVARDQTLPKFELHLPLLSLPRLFGTELETIPRNTPYLRATAEVPCDLPGASAGTWNIGLVWAGNPRHENDLNRSLNSARLRDLVSALRPNRIYALQTGPRHEEASQLAGVTMLAPHLVDFSHAAAFVQRLDLVISVDTSMAHLAGALGQKVWVLLPWAPDWRWLLGTDESPWYPSARLFRQPSRGDWASVIQAVARALAAEDKSPPTRPPA